jgi:hypothetical protein
MASSDLASYITVKLGSYSSPWAQHGDIFIGWRGVIATLILNFDTRSSRVVNLNFQAFTPHPPPPPKG